MPRTTLVLYQEDDGSVPILAWFDELHPKPRDKCLVALEHLEEHGHELRRPQADYLERKVYELRVKHSGTNYRMLYFFHEQEAVVVSHGFTKQRADVPKKEIDKAEERKNAFEKNPEKHTFVPEED